MSPLNWFRTLYRRKPGKAWLEKNYLALLERAQMREQVFALSVAVIIGVLCGFGAVGFRFLVKLVNRVFWGAMDVTPGYIAGLSWWHVLLAPAAGGLIVGPIIYFYSREAKGHGVPEVMAAVAMREGVIRLRVAFAKAVASAFTIGSGGSAGKEGPIIQIGAAIGSWVGQFLRVSKKQLRTYVGCGAAAGIAATFNAPIAGALFAVEVILGQFALAQFSSIVISSVIATVIARHYFADGPVFTAPQHYELVSAWELFPYLLLGILCGLVSVAFIKILYKSEDFFDGLTVLPGYLKPMLGGLLLGFIGIFLPHVYGDGEFTINLALHGGMSWWFMGLLLFAKIAATSMTLGSGGSGGVFTPSLFIGAVGGGMIGHLTGYVMGASAGESGGYALVAMGGLVAGTMHAPITAILMIFEITYNYHIILPLMIVCIISILISSRFNSESIYTLKLVREGIDLFHGKSMDMLKTHKVSSCARDDYESVQPDTTANDLVDRWVGGSHTQFYVIDRKELYQGVILLGELSRILTRRTDLEQVLLAEDLCHSEIAVCYPDESLSHALLKFEQSKMTELPVVNSPVDWKLTGVIRYTDVISIYNNELMKRDTADTLMSRLSSSELHERVKIVEGFSIAEWGPPPSLHNLTLDQIRMPSRYGVSVVLVKKKEDGRPGARRILPVTPGPDYVVGEDDIFIVYGRNEDLDRLPRV